MFSPTKRQSPVLLQGLPPTWFARIDPFFLPQKGKGFWYRAFHFLGFPGLQRLRVLLRAFVLDGLRAAGQHRGGVHPAERAAARLRGPEAHLGHEAGAGEHPRRRAKASRFLFFWPPKSAVVTWCRWFFPLAAKKEWRIIIRCVFFLLQTGRDQCAEPGHLWSDAPDLHDHPPLPVPIRRHGSVRALLRPSASVPHQLLGHPVAEAQFFSGTLFRFSGPSFSQIVHQVGGLGPGFQRCLVVSHALVQLCLVGSPQIESAPTHKNGSSEGVITQNRLSCKMPLSPRNLFWTQDSSIEPVGVRDIYALEFQIFKNPLWSLPPRPRSFG